MNNRTNQPDNGETELGNLPAEDTASQRQSVAVSAVVFHKPNSSAGIFRIINVSGSSLGDMMERERAHYQEFLPKKSTLRRFISKVVVEQGTVDHSTTYNFENNFPVQVRTNIEVDNLTEAFYNPQKFRGIPLQNAGLDVYYLPTPTAPSSQKVVSFRTILNKRRLFWILVTTMLGSLSVAGIIAALLSGSIQTAGVVIGVVMGLFCLIVAMATWLWRLN